MLNLLNDKDGKKQEIIDEWTRWGFQKEYCFCVEKSLTSKLASNSSLIRIQSDPRIWSIRARRDGSTSSIVSKRYFTKKNNWQWQGIRCECQKKTEHLRGLSACIPCELRFDCLSTNGRQSRVKSIFDPWSTFCSFSSSFLSELSYKSSSKGYWPTNLDRNEQVSFVGKSQN